MYLLLVSFMLFPQLRLCPLNYPTTIALECPIWVSDSRIVRFFARS
jgi:hypothetical protein